jgi:predicted permease
LVPALQLTRLNLTPALKSTAQEVKSESLRVRFPIGKILVIAQVAVSLILLVAAGLFVRSLTRLSQVNLGFTRENLLLFGVNPAAGGYNEAATQQLYQQLLVNVAAIPGVRSVTVSHNGLFYGSESGDPVVVEGYTPNAGEQLGSRMDHVGPRYFSTLGIPILEGREIEERDSTGAIRAAVVNQSFARHFFPHTDPIGKHVRDAYPGNPTDLYVVGVVSDAKYNSLREQTPDRLYAPLFNPMWDQREAVFEVRTLADPASVSDSIRHVVESTSNTIPPIEIKTMSGLVDDSLQTDRFIERLAEAFGALAMLLACVGLYGIMAYGVARRSREIGIRLTLGAAPGNIRRQILRETLLLVLVGISLGVPVALLGTRLVRGMIFGLGFTDPVALLAASLLLLLVAVLAGILPAYRASKVDPIIALRYE